MKKHVKTMPLQKHLRLICLVILTSLYGITNAQPCQLNGVSVFPVTPPNVMRVHTGCNDKVIRLTYAFANDSVSWSGITDSIGNLDIITGATSVTLGNLTYSDVDAIASKVIRQTSELPTGRSSYTGQFDGRVYSGSDIIKITAAEHSNFSRSQFPPDTINSIKVDSFDSDANFNLVINGLVTSIQTNAKVSIDLKFVKQIGTKKYFLAEMTRLDINGGTLPSNVKIRESEDEQSTGVTIIDSIPASPFMRTTATIEIQSYFDIRIDVSMDGGLTWVTSNKTGLMIMHNKTNVPTLSQWGLIILALLVLSAGIFFILKR